MKKLTKEQKLKKTIKELNSKLKEALSYVEYYKGRYDGLEDKIEKVNDYLSRIEGTQVKYSEERDWLRKLIEMVLVDASKFEKLKELKQSIGEPYGKI